MTSSDTGLRSDGAALARVVELLAPDGAAPMPRAKGAWHRRGSPEGHRSWTVVPTRGRPRYLIPIGRRRVSGAIRFRVSRRRLGRVASGALSLLLRFGVASLLPGRVSVPDGSADEPSLVRWLATELDQPGLVAAIALGSPRANRKPVLQLIAGDGSTIGFGKLAVDTHTASLVRSEATFLASVPAQPSPPLQLPILVLHDTWKGLELLVVQDLGIGLEGGNDLRLTADAVRAIASLGPRHQGPVVDGVWWSDVERRIRSLGGADRALLDRSLTLARSALADLVWEFGQWHGDLAPWNATWRDGALVAWDWERAGGPVPLGFDALHNRFQVALLRQRRPGPDAVRATLSEDAALLADLGYDAAGASALMVGYLLELRTRLAEDASYGDLGQVQWYADELTAALRSRVGS